MTKLDNITNSALEKYEALILISSSPATSKRKQASLRKFFAWAKAKGYVSPEIYPKKEVVITNLNKKPQTHQNTIKVINLSLYLIMVSLVLFIINNYLSIGHIKKVTKLPSVQKQAQNDLASTSIPVEDVLGTNTEDSSPSAQLSDIYYNGLLTLPTDNPTIAANSGLLVSAESLLLTTARNSDGDITVNPDGAGKVNFILNGDTGNQLNINNANLNTGSLIDAYVGNDSNNFNLLLLEDGAKPTTRFSVDSQGNTFASGNITSSGNISLNGNLNTGNTSQSGTVATFTNSSANCILDPSLTGGLSCSSDENLKKDINTLGSGLSQILSLNPVTFQWINGDSSTKIGFLAQDVEKIIPEAVRTNSQGSKSLSYGTLIPYIIKAIQELNNKVSENIGVGANITSHFLADGSSFIIDNITAGAITTKDFTTENFKATTANITNLVASKINSNTISTDLVTPLTGTNVAVSVGNASESGRFAVQNSHGDEVANIDSQGNASISSNLNAGSALINGDATISGTLYATNIVSQDTQNSRDQIEKILSQVEQDESLITQSNQWKDFIASDSAKFADLTASNLYITNQAAIESLSVNKFFSLADLTISTLTKSDGSTFASINTLTSPLSIQYLALAPVDFEGGKVVIDTLGNVTIAANLKVAGNITTDTLQTSKLVIASDNTATPSGILNDSLIETNATAGVATISAGLSQIVIDNPNVSSTTLVYITPTSSTSNQVLYIKNKSEGYFTVGFGKPITNDASFNWWVIDSK